VERPQRITVSAAAFVLICFFLPWIQLSCMGVRDSASGFDLARSGERILWLLPLLMLAIIILGLVRFIWERTPSVFALASAAGGAISAYLMGREYSQTEKSASLLAAQWTAWFWLGLVTSVLIAVASLAFYAKRSRSP
jgi:hypothetical protein